MHKIDLLLNDLEEGMTLTASEIEADYGIARVYDAIRKLRLDGYAVYLNARKAWDGSKEHFYRLGNPSERFIRHYNANRTRLANKALYSSARS